MNEILSRDGSPTADEINARHARLKEESPQIRARNAAVELGISEGDLLAAKVGKGATRLVDDAEAVLKDIVALREVMALTRNESCVHERKGIYENPSFFTHGPMRTGLFVNPDIDLRLFMPHWIFIFAVSEPTKSGNRKSLQFFDKEGQAIHKVYLTHKSNEAAYDDLVTKHRHPKQATSIEIEPYPSREPETPDSEIDWPAFRTAWEELQDTHDFFPLLRKFKVTREQAFRNVGPHLALELDNGAARKVLELAGDTNCEIMVFVGNRGCIQIHTGPVKKLVEHGHWYNVLDPMFNLHLSEADISHSWATRKPTEDGIVTAVEVFDAQGEAIVTFFGKRKPGEPELVLWRQIVDQLTPKEGSDVA
ncbi:MAG: hemin-degrading factor [Proteobacteria bacterium]|nr:hemin-degrading factor [Pseudomonadota bacterium]